MLKKMIKLLLLSFLCISSLKAEIKVKIDFKNFNKEIYFSEEYLTKFYQELLFTDDDTNTKYSLVISPVKAVKVNGQDIRPIQFDLKIMDEKISSAKPITVTSFYRPEASFFIGLKDAQDQRKGLQITILQ